MIRTVLGGFWWLLLYAGALAWGGTVTAQPQRFTIEHLTREHGLSHNTVVSLFQDSRGFIWIGTIDGLNRFDGYSCLVFRHNPSDSNSLSSSFVHGLIEDRHGFLWIGTRSGGLSRYNPSTGAFKTYLLNPSGANGLTGRTVGPLFVDSNGVIWAGTENGLGWYDRTSDVFVRSVMPERVATDDLSLASVISVNDSTFLLLTEKALYIYVPSSGAIETFIPPLPAHNFYHGILRDEAGALWVGTNSNGVFRLDVRQKKWKHVPARPEGEDGVSSPYAIPKHVDTDGRIWFMTQNGLDIYDPSSERFSRLRHSEGNPSTISSNNVSAMMRDAHGDIWVGTWGGGVDRIVRSRIKFPLLTGSEILSSNFVLAVLEDRRGQLWVGTNAGLDRISDRRRANIRRTAITGVGAVGVWCLMEDSQGDIWVGTDRNGIVILDSSGRVQRVMKHDPKDGRSLPENSVRVLFTDRHGNIWAGLQTKGVARYDRASRSWHLFPSGRRDGKSISDVLVWAINEDRQGNLWFGSYTGGVSKLDPTTGTVTYYFHTPADTTLLPVDDVRGITVTQSGELWVATYGGGICRYNPETDSFTWFTERHGLANNFTYGILEDSEGALWITTNRGLSRLTPADRKFRTYTSRDGLQSDEFNTGAYSKSRTGELLVGGIGGVNYFYPNEIKGNSRPPAVVLTSFKVFDRELLGGKLPAAGDTIVLQYSDNFFSFEFAALDFVDPLRNEYMYRLEGFDNDWIRAGTRRYASYTNLDPGHYVLNIRAANGDGVWNEEGTRLHITVVPPFYQRWWFRSLTGVVLIAAFAAVVRYASTRKLRRQLRELEKERALQNERERISRDLHDHAGAQLASIIAGLEVAEKYIADSNSRMKELIDSLRDDARASMMRLRETIWALKTNAMTAEEFAEAVRNFAERQLKYRSGVDILVENRITSECTLSPAQVLNLFRIVQEAVINALKHADARLIRVIVEREEDILRLCVQDDGKRRAAQADIFSGRGMLNMKARADELNGVFHFRSDTGAGSTVEVKVPLVLNGTQMR